MAINVTAFKANSEDTILSKFGDKTVDEAIAIIPSTLMKTPSLSFAIGYSSVFKPRVIKTTLYFTSSEIEVSSFKALLASNVGVHIISFRETLTIPVSDFLDNEESSVYITVEYVPNDPQNMDYPLDNVGIITQKSTDTPPANSIKMLTVNVSGGEIISVVDNYDETLEPALQGWVDDNYLTQADASDGYLSKADASNTYLTQIDASSTYLTQTDASNTYLTQIDASDTYLTQTDASDTYLTQTDADTMYLDEESVPIQLNRLVWTDYKGVSRYIDKLHQEFVDIRLYSLTTDESSETSITLESRRLGVLTTSGDIQTLLTDIKGTFIGNRKNSWFDLAMYINLTDFTIDNTRSSESTDRWSFNIEFPLQTILRANLNNALLEIRSSDNDKALYQGACNVQLTGYSRDDGSKVLTPFFLGICYISDGLLKLSVHGDIQQDETTISKITGLGIKVKISGIGRI